MSAVPNSNSPTLARTMGLGALIIYGVGDMLGAGVYGLIGTYAGKMGNAIWLAFALSMVAAIFTGLSYASLGSRYPRAAGAAYITHRAFNLKFLSYAIGLTICASGLTSFATQSRAFAGYMLGYMGQGLPGAKDTLPDAAPFVVFGLAVLFILLLTVVNFWGMKEATWLNAVCTAVEVGGLVLIILVGVRYIGGVNLLEIPAPPPAGSPEGTPMSSTTLGTLGLGGIGAFALQGAILTFYSFIGFEDMINVSEEVKDPQRTFPKGVIYALIITAIVYALVSIVAISVIPWRELSGSSKPMVDVMAVAAPWFPSWAFGAIAMFAIANTALLNYIMGSRLVYGMAKQGFLPKFLGTVHPTRKTPHIAILVLTVIVIGLVLVGDIRALATATSTLLLFIFIVVNAALLALQRRKSEPKGFFEVPNFVPIGGILVSLMMIGSAIYEAFYDESRQPPFVIALGLLAFVTVLYFVMKPKEITEETLSSLEAA